MVSFCYSVSVFLFFLSLFFFSFCIQSLERLTYCFIRFPSLCLPFQTTSPSIFSSLQNGLVILLPFSALRVLAGEHHMKDKPWRILNCGNENCLYLNPLNPELNPMCCLLALLGAHHFLRVSRIRVKSLTFRQLMSYIYGAPILDVSRSHTTAQHSR